MCRIDIREASIRDVTFVLAAMLLVVAIFILYLKRHIERMRFQITTIPGMPYMQGLQKMMLDEIEECLSIVATIRKEPQLLLGRPVDLSSNVQATTGPSSGGTAGSTSDIVPRMKTIDAMKQLDAALAEAAPQLKRRPFADVRRHLCDPRVTGGPLKLASLDVINDFLSLYEHARFDPGYYGPEKLDEFNELLKQLLYAINSASQSGGKSNIGHRPSTGGASVSSGGGGGAGGGASSGPGQQQPEERLLPISSAVRRPLLADPGS